MNDDEDDLSIQFAERIDAFIVEGRAHGLDDAAMRQALELALRGFVEGDGD